MVSLYSWLLRQFEPMWLVTRGARRVGMGLCISALASFNSSAHRAESTAKISAAEQQNGSPQRILYKDRAEFERKVAKMAKDGSDKLQVITDFDFTLSKFWVNGERGASCHRVIEDCGMMSDEYHTKAQALQHYYYAIEVDPKMPKKEKVGYMVEWVEKAHELMLASGMTQDMIKLAVADANIRVREGITELFDLTENNSIPMLIFSAGIADVLEEVLRYHARLPSNAVVISNRMIFSPTGELSGFKDPVLHVFNKRASTALESPYFQDERNRERSNVVLIGDSTADPDMTMGIDFGTVLKIGFLNDKVERLDAYLQVYDVVLLGDGDLSLASSLVNEICGQTAIVQ